MTDEDLGTVGGTPLTREALEAWAAEAEAGYTLDQLQAPGKRLRRPAQGVRRTVVLHLPAPVAEALTNRAAATRQTTDH